MDESYAVINRPSVFMYNREHSDREDELLCGWAVKILDTAENYCKITTHYGYEGYVEKEALTTIPRSSILNAASNDNVMVVTHSFVDILSQPMVQSSIQVTLPRGAFVIKQGRSNNGYQRVATVDSQYVGFVRECSIRRRLDSDQFLMNPSFSFLDQQLSLDKDEVREQICSSALDYLGTPYCWGGKTPKGIDCSGLVFMSYMLSGILIFRNSQNNELYPVKLISCDKLEKADLIYWAGHVGMYLGKNQYIHSTGNAADFKCVISSLSSDDNNYRSDLAGSIIGYGSIF